MNLYNKSTNDILSYSHEIIPLERKIFNTHTKKSFAWILGAIGAGILPCPDCGTPIIVHHWPIAVLICIVGMIKKFKRKANLDLS